MLGLIRAKEGWCGLSPVLEETTLCRALRASRTRLSLVGD